MKIRTNKLEYAEEDELEEYEAPAEKSVAELTLSDMEASSKRYRQILLDPRAQYTRAEFDQKNSDRALKDAQGTLAVQVEQLKRKDAQRKYSHCWEITIENIALKLDAVPGHKALHDEYDKAQKNYIANMRAALNTIIVDWKAETQWHKKVYTSETPIRQVCPYPEDKCGAVHLRTLGSAITCALEFVSATTLNIKCRN